MIHRKNQHACWRHRFRSTDLLLQKYAQVKAIALVEIERMQIYINPIVHFHSGQVIIRMNRISW